MIQRVVLLCILSWGFILPTYAQQKIVVNVLQETNIEEVAKARSKRIVQLLSSKIQWDSLHQTMFFNRYMDAERRYFRTFRTENPKVSSVLLRNQGLLRLQRNEILRSLLPPTEYSKFLTLESEVQKKDILRQKLDIHTSTPILKGQMEALAWDLLLDTFSFERK